MWQGDGGGGNGRRRLIKGLYPQIKKFRLWMKKVGYIQIAPARWLWLDRRLQEVNYAN